MKRFCCLIPALACLFFLWSCKDNPFKGTDTNDPKTYVRRGHELIKAKRAKEALEVMKAGSELFPNNADIRRTWALAGEGAGQLELARREMINACWMIFLDGSQKSRYASFRDEYVRIRDLANSKNAGAPGFTDYVAGGPQLGHLARIKDTMEDVEYQEMNKAVQLYKARFNRVPQRIADLVQTQIISQSILQDSNGHPVIDFFQNGILTVRMAGPDQVILTDDDKIYQYK